uniref:Uncharacterized protein n=2 Tax=Anguilla anguilla TaxID=7936 RepID=A0A0E9P7I1_ANGAN
MIKWYYIKYYNLCHMNRMFTKPLISNFISFVSKVGYM